MTAALQKLPDHAGQTFRLVNPKYGITSYAAKIRPGDYVSDSGFSASSLFKDVGGAAGKWAEPGGLYFDVKGSSGKILELYSRIGTEAEVLFLPGAGFHVDAIKVDGDQTVWVLLTQAMPPHGTVVKNAFTGDPL